MTCVIGIDLSLTGTGMCRLMAGDHPTVVDSTTYVSRPNPNPTLATRTSRLLTLVDLVTVHIGQARRVDLVAVEGPSLGKPSPHTWDRAGLWWLAMERLSLLAPVVEIPPTVLKKFATNNGSADKTAVAAQMARMWPVATARNDNEWDALALAHAAAWHLGADVPVRAWFGQALRKVQWPTLIDTEEQSA